MAGWQVSLPVPISADQSGPAELAARVFLAGLAVWTNKVFAKRPEAASLTLFNPSTTGSLRELASSA